MTFETILVEVADGVALIMLNRPKALNALNTQILVDLTAALDKYEPDPSVGCFVITGSEKAFAAGADIKEMSDKGFVEMADSDFFAGWGRITACRKPVIAAVSGFALGGGCELAMMADFIIASETAKFGQPEIKLAVIPGMGGSQRLTRAVGKAKAMDLCLTGRMMDAAEAERSGLVSRVVPADKLMETTMEAAKAIASFSIPAVRTCKEVVNRAFESSLAEGVLYERRAIHALFGTEDKMEGMAAFLEKRPPNFKNR